MIITRVPIGGLSGTIDSINTVLVNDPNQIEDTTEYPTGGSPSGSTNDKEIITPSTLGKSELIIPVKETEAMSKNLKNGLIIGASALVLCIILFIIYKKTK